MEVCNLWMLATCFFVLNSCNQGNQSCHHVSKIRNTKKQHKSYIWSEKKSYPLTVARELPFAATYGTLFGGKYSMYSATSPTRVILIVFATFYLLYFPYRTSLSTTWLNTSFGLCIKNQGTFWLSQRSRTTPGIKGCHWGKPGMEFLDVCFLPLGWQLSNEKRPARLGYLGHYTTHSICGDDNKPL